MYIDLQKAFDTVKHSILINKLSYYGVRGIANNWFKTLLTNRQHFTSIEENSSDKITNTHGLPQGSVLGPLLFLIYINDLHKAIKNSDVYHYADDTNLLLTHKSPKKINKLINQDLTTLCKWLRANKISLNAAKTEIIIFRRKNTQVLKKLNFCLSGQKIEVTDQVKYLGILLNSTLTWVTHLNDLIKKLNCAIGLLVKIRHYTPKFSLKGIYCSIFNSHLIYGCQVWGQREIESQLLKTIGTLQDKAICIINFLPNETTVQNIYKKDKILKIKDYIKLQNILFVRDCLENEFPKAFNQYFTKAGAAAHNHGTCSTTKNCIRVENTKTTSYGKDSLKSQSIKIWGIIYKQKMI